MKTVQRCHFDDARDMQSVADKSVQLVVTSPPYPMIGMWDDHFTRMNPAVAKAIERGDGWRAFELMHAELEPVWRETHRILAPGGIACINIGDAVRSVGGEFRLYPNHARMQAFCCDIGFSALPMIIWRKPTNAPSKFMGSGMLPPAAYVTLEHECILILRKGPGRKFESREDKDRRRASAYFWEERNAWFTDLWRDVKGVGQHMPGGRIRGRSAAFPFEIPYRLISMFSVKGDRVVDPFVGTGTTMAATAAAGRNAVGFELESAFAEAVNANLRSCVPIGNQRIRRRLDNHLEFVGHKSASGHRFKHTNRHYGFPVMTGQETELLLNEVLAVQRTGKNEYTVSYGDKPQRVTLPTAATRQPRN